jgi:hypothetical protein
MNHHILAKLQFEYDRSVKQIVTLSDLDHYKNYFDLFGHGNC